MSIVLCYNKERGLYTNSCSGDTLPSEGLFQEHDNSGFRTKVISVPDSSIEIIIKSNLHFGRASYLYATIKDGGKNILNFEDVDDLFCLDSRKYRVQEYSVDPGDWDSLFEKVVLGSRGIIKFDSISRYFKELQSFVDADSNELKERMKNTTKHVALDDYAILYHASNRLVNLLDYIPKSTVSNIEDVVEMMNELCFRFVCRFHRDCLSLDLERHKVSHGTFSKNIGTIINYLESQSGPMETLKALQEACKQSV